MPIRTIHELLGPADIATMMRYAHLSPTVKREAVQSLRQVEPAQRQPASEVK